MVKQRAKPFLFLSALCLGTDLLLHGGTVLPLARLSLTAVFGMGTGVAPRL